MNLLITDLNIYVYIGILEEELERKQKINVNVRVEYDYKDQYLDYIEILKDVRELLETKKYGLLESAIQDISFNLFEKYDEISNIHIGIHKMEILKDCKIGISCNFNREHMKLYNV